MDELDFGSVETEPVAVLAPPPPEMVLEAWLAIGVFALIVAGTTWLAMRARDKRTASWPTLNRLPPAARVLAGMVFVSLLVVQVTALIDVYYQTQIQRESTRAYFDEMTMGRLLGVSHSHVFGFAFTYAVIGLLLCMTPVREWIKCLLVAAILWGGIFDVGSWWLVKYLSPDFETLSMATASVTGGTSLVAFFLVGRGLLSTEEEIETESEQEATEWDPDILSSH